MNPSSLSGIGKYVGMALTLPISTLVGYAMGHTLDAFFHTTWLRWVLAGIGMVAGVFDLIYELDKEK